MEEAFGAHYTINIIRNPQNSIGKTSSPYIRVSGPDLSSGWTPKPLALKPPQKKLKTPLWTPHRSLKGALRGALNILGFGV